MGTKTKQSLETLTAQGMGYIDPTTKSVNPPIYLSTTFERNEDLSYHEDRVYTRADNPSYDLVTKLLTRLEYGVDSHLFASGMAAAVAIFQALNPRDHVLVPTAVYNGIRTWLRKYASPWGIDYGFYPNNDSDGLLKVIKPGKTKLIWIETPANPEMQMTDISLVTKIAKQVGATVVCDNTVATPILTNPLKMDVDIVLHSATKYLNGHGDVLAGVLITRKKSELWKRIVSIAHDGGAIPGPFESWLLLRGLRTLYLRMNKICDNALKIAQFLDNHPMVVSVCYPGLPSFYDYDLAKTQMNGGFGGVISFHLKGGKEKAINVQSKTKVFKRATSLGSVESFIEHRKSYEGDGSSVPEDLLRLSIGIENAEDLIEDLNQALRA